MAEKAFTEHEFNELDIDPEILRALAEMGFDRMTPIQQQAIPALLTGRDIIGQAQTGTGKTCAFGVPILQMVDPMNKDLQAIILCPTRELAVQAANELRAYAKFMHDVKVLPVYGGQDISRQIQALKGVQIITGTPGRVMDHMRRHTVKMDSVQMVVLDEADEMLDMGFREDMEVILGAIEHPHQTCLFSATMPPEILEITGQFQNDPEYLQVSKDELTINRIHQYYYPIKHEYKNQALIRLLSYYDYSRSIVFCNTKAMVDDLAALLQKEGWSAEGLHGDLTQKQRDSVMGRFRNGSLRILLATDIAARGIDVDDVEAVFNYDIPSEVEYYIHRIGRTGRAGKEGEAHTLCRSKDFRLIRIIEKVSNTLMEERRVPDIAQILEARRQQVLERTAAAYNDGLADELVPVIRAYCAEHGITAEELAASFLSRNSGKDIEEVEVNLPPAKPRRDDRFRDHEERRDGHFDEHDTEEPQHRGKLSRSERKRIRRESEEAARVQSEEFLQDKKRRHEERKNEERRTEERRHDDRKHDDRRHAEADRGRRKKADRHHAGDWASYTDWDADEQFDGVRNDRKRRKKDPDSLESRVERIFFGKKDESRREDRRSKREDKRGGRGDAKREDRRKGRQKKHHG